MEPPSPLPNTTGILRRTTCFAVLGNRPTYPPPLHVRFGAPVQCNWYPLCLQNEIGATSDHCQSGWIMEGAPCVGYPSFGKPQQMTCRGRPRHDENQKLVGATFILLTAIPHLSTVCIDLFNSTGIEREVEPFC